MKDSAGKELVRGQTVKERGHAGVKIKVMDFSDPFVVIQREGHYENGFCFPSDLTIVEEHEINVSFVVRAPFEEEATTKVSGWVKSHEASIPNGTLTYKVAAK
jgi:hypothetical protein